MLSYDEPYGWWGPGRHRQRSPSLAQLVERGTVSLPAAALLAAAVHRRWSLAVVAEPSGAGKTTLLSALLPWLPAATRRFYLRGRYEPFAFLDDPVVDPGGSVLLCNEISPHLPIYLWGDGVQRLLAARRRGYQIAATAHAADALGLVRLLTGPPLRITADLVAGFDLVVGLGLGRDEEARDPGYMVTGIWRLRSGRPGAVEVVAVGGNGSTIEHLAGALGDDDGSTAAPVLEADAIAAAAKAVSAAGAAEALADVADERSPTAADDRPGPPLAWRPRRSRPNG